MIDNLLQMVGVDLQAQIARMRGQVEDFKDKTTRDIKEQVAETGITIGLALAGAIFALWTIFIGLIALFFWVEAFKGPFVALGAVAAVTALMAALMFAMAASRGKHSAAAPRPAPAAYKPPPAAAAAAAAAPPKPKPAAAPQPAFTASPNASFVEAVTEHLTHRAAGATSEALDAAAELVRKSPKQAVIATLLAAVTVGVFFGRRR